MAQNSQKSQLVRTTSCFPPSAIYIALPGSMKTGPQEGGFQVQSASNLPSPVSRVCGVSNLWEAKDIAIVIACIVWGVSWATLTNNTKGDFSRFILDFL